LDHPEYGVLKLDDATWAVVHEITGFLLPKASKISGRKVDTVARSIEHNVLNLEPWEVRKKF
jgi:hypothetical protein